MVRGCTGEQGWEGRGLRAAPSPWMHATAGKMAAGGCLLPIVAVSLACALARVRTWRIRCMRQHSAVRWSAAWRLHAGLRCSACRQQRPGSALPAAGLHTDTRSPGRSSSPSRISHLQQQQRACWGQRQAPYMTPRHLQALAALAPATAPDCAPSANTHAVLHIHSQHMQGTSRCNTSCQARRHSSSRYQRQSRQSLSSRSCTRSEPAHARQGTTAAHQDTIKPVTAAGP